MDRVFSHSKQTIKSCFEHYDAHKYVFPGFASQSELRKPSFKNLFILLDCSGSTNNFAANNRSAQDGCDRLSGENVQSTKIIILALLEGVATLLEKYYEKYDMTGVTLHVIPFSTSFFTFTFQLKNNCDIIRIVKALDTLPYEQNGTKLLNPLKNVFEKFNDNAEIILATDGQPETKSDVMNFLKTPEVTSKTFNMFVIGAGSITKEVAHDYFYSCTRNSDGESTRYDNGQMRNSPVPSHVHLQVVTKTDGECDKEFLEEIASCATKIGTYSGAFGNYETLKNAAQKYFELHLTKKIVFGVAIDGGFAVYSNQINEAIAKYGSVLAKLPHGTYLINNEIQLCVTTIPQMSADIYAFTGTKPLIPKFNDIANKKVSARSNIQYGQYQLSLVGTTDGLPRIRIVKATEYLV